jgi:hypothetical protein
MMPGDEPMAPQDIHADQSNIILNIAANNYLKSSDLKFGAIIFYEKYSDNMDKFTTTGLSSNMIFRGATHVIIVSSQCLVLWPWNKISQVLINICFDPSSCCRNYNIIYCSLALPHYLW